MKPTKIRPMFNHVLVTCDRYDADQTSDSGLVISINKKKGDIKEIQKVVAVGNTVTAVKPGDYVQLNPTRYMMRTDSIKDVGKSKAEYKFEFPVVQLKGKNYLFLFDSDIDYVVEEFEPDADTMLYVPPKDVV